jgi:hypothetical protein
MSAAGATCNLTNMAIGVDGAAEIRDALLEHVCVCFPCWSCRVSFPVDFFICVILQI